MRRARVYRAYRVFRFIGFIGFILFIGFIGFIRFRGARLSISSSFSETMAWRDSSSGRYSAWDVDLQGFKVSVLSERVFVLPSWFLFAGLVRS